MLDLVCLGGSSQGWPGVFGWTITCLTLCVWVDHHRVGPVYLGGPSQQQKDVVRTSSLHGGQEAHGHRKGPGTRHSHFLQLGSTS